MDPRKLLKWYRFYKTRDRMTPYDARRQALQWTGPDRPEHAHYWQQRNPDPQPAAPEPETGKRTRRSSFVIAALRGH